jgi:hypothetical protein
MGRQRSSSPILLRDRDTSTGCKFPTHIESQWCPGGSSPASTMDAADTVCSSSPVLRMEFSSNSCNCVSRQLSWSDLWAGARSPLWRRRGPGSGSALGGPGGAVEGARPGREGGRRPVMRGSLETGPEYRRWDSDWGRDPATGTVPAVIAVAPSQSPGRRPWPSPARHSGHTEVARSRNTRLRDRDRYRDTYRHARPSPSRYQLHRCRSRRWSRSLARWLRSKIPQGQNGPAAGQKFNRCYLIIPVLGSCPGGSQAIG